LITSLRPYTVLDYKNIAANLRLAIPDIAISTEHFSEPLGSEKKIEESIFFYKKAFSFDFDVDDLRLFWKNKGFFNELPIFKVALLLQFDFQIATQVYCDHLAENYQLIAALNEQYWKPLCEMPLIDKEQFKLTNANWYKFLLANTKKVVPIVHFIGDNEFNFKPLINRKYDWSVPGAKYYAREKASLSLKLSHATKSSNNSVMQKTVKLFSRAGFQPYSNDLILTILSETFTKSISNSRFSYTCGSALNYPIRKFFEIPALGAVLVCMPCNGFEGLGFIDGENAIICLPENIDSVTEKFLKNPNLAQKIATAGQKLILEKHSLYVRAEQLRKAMMIAYDGKYQGAFWKNGNMIFTGDDVDV